jgi:hypothetical protein
MSCCKGNPAKAVTGAVKLAAVELGLWRPPAELVAARRAACEACDRWDHGRCGECGCYTFAKTRLRSEKCPLGKWDA